MQRASGSQCHNPVDFRPEPKTASTVGLKGKGIGTDLGENQNRHQTDSREKRGFGVLRVKRKLASVAQLCPVFRLVSEQRLSQPGVFLPLPPALFLRVPLSVLRRTTEVLLERTTHARTREPGPVAVTDPVVNFYLLFVVCRFVNKHPLAFQLRPRCIGGIPIEAGIDLL